MTVVDLAALITDQLGGSRSEARRLIAQGAVSIDGEPVTSLLLPFDGFAGRQLQVGTRRTVSVPHLPPVTADVRRIKLDPGDVLAVRVPESILACVDRREILAALREDLNLAFPGHRTAILPAGYELDVASTAANTQALARVLADEFGDALYSQGQVSTPDGRWEDRDADDQAVWRRKADRVANALLAGEASG